MGNISRKLLRIPFLLHLLLIQESRTRQKMRQGPQHRLVTRDRALGWDVGSLPQEFEASRMFKEWRTRDLGSNIYIRWGKTEGQDHGIIKAGKDSKIIKANLDLIPPMPPKPRHKMPHPLRLLDTSKDVTPPLLWAVCPSAWPLFPWRNIQPESPLVQLEVGPHSPSPPGTERGDSQGCTIPLLCLLNLFQGFWMLCPAFSPPTSSSTILKGENRPKVC